MDKKAIFIFFLYFLSLIPISYLLADERVENIGIYLVLDKSLSMTNEIEAVKEYVINQILEKVVILGDYFLLIPFYGSTDASFNGYLSSRIEMEDLRYQIENVKADGRFTDIGNALDILGTSIKLDNQLTKKYMLLITDGKQEAPPHSPFYSIDGSFNHKFLENTKEIQKYGWKIIVLGIGNNSSAKEIAQELSAGYSIVANNTSSRDIDKSIDNFLGRVDITNFPDKIRLNKNGNAVIKIELQGTNFDKSKDIKILEIKMISDNRESINILKNTFEFQIDPDKVSNINIPVIFPSERTGYEAELTFSFGSEVAFTPAVHKIEVSKSKGILVFIYYLFISIAIIITIFYLRKIIQYKKVKDKNKQNGTI